jgi:hypothetical protein
LSHHPFTHLGAGGFNHPANKGFRLWALGGNLGGAAATALPERIAPFLRHELALPFSVYSVYSVVKTPGLFFVFHAFFAVKWKRLHLRLWCFAFLCAFALNPICHPLPRILYFAV